jgi:hypothetical protein
LCRRNHSLWVGRVGGRAHVLTALDMRNFEQGGRAVPRTLNLVTDARLPPTTNGTRVPFGFVTVVTTGSSITFVNNCFKSFAR